VTTLVLKSVLDDLGLSQGVLARVTGLSRPAVNALVNNGAWPARAERDSLK